MSLQEDETTTGDTCSGENPFVCWSLRLQKAVSFGVSKQQGKIAAHIEFLAQTFSRTVLLQSRGKNAFIKGAFTLRKLLVNSVRMHEGNLCGQYVAEHVAITRPHATSTCHSVPYMFSSLSRIKLSNRFRNVATY